MRRRPPIPPPFPYTTLSRPPDVDDVDAEVAARLSLRLVDGQAERDRREPPGRDVPDAGERLRPAARAAGRQRGPGDRQQRLRSEEHTSELQSRQYLVCRLLL